MTGYVWPPGLPPNGGSSLPSGVAQAVPVGASAEAAQPLPPSLSYDKKTYNAFHWKLKQAPPEVQSEWKEVQKTEEAAEFMKVILASKGGKGYPEAFLQKCRGKVTEKVSGEEGRWISWSEASTKEGGDDILTEMLNAGTIQIRKNPKLPVNSSIKYPRSQQVAYVEDVWSRKIKDVEEEMVIERDHQEDIVREYKESVPLMEGIKSEVEPAPKGPAPQPHGGKFPEENAATKAAVTNCRKMHSQWDRISRDWGALVIRSKAHPNTVGCKLQLDIEKALVAGSKLDKYVVEMEIAFRDETKPPDTKLLKKVADACKELTGIIKQGQNKAIALKPWFKIEG